MHLDFKITATFLRIGYRKKHLLCFKSCYRMPANLNAIDYPLIPNGYSPGRVTID